MCAGGISKHGARNPSVIEEQIIDSAEGDRLREVFFGLIETADEHFDQPATLIDLW